MEAPGTFSSSKKKGKGLESPSSTHTTLLIDLLVTLSDPKHTRRSIETIVVNTGLLYVTIHLNMHLIR